MIKKLSFALALAWLFLPAAANADAYEDCLGKAAKPGDTAKCHTEEADKILLLIKEQYELAAKQPDIAKWSGGGGMRSGKLRKLYEEWLVYRDMYCDAYQASNGPFREANGYDDTREKCLRDMTKDHYFAIKALNDSATADFD